MRSLALLLAFACACSAKSDGPTPVLLGVQPDPICDAQKMITLTLTGTGFSPAVDNGLTSSPIVVMPRVVLSDGTGTTIEIPSEDVSLPDTTGTVLSITVPQSLVPPGTYDVTVTNPDGNSNTVTGGLTVDPPPQLISVSPTVGNIGQMVTVTLTGTGFRQTMTVTLDATPPVPGTNLVVSADGTTAMVTFDLAGVAAGTYSITVDNLDGCTSTLAMAFTVRSLEFSLLGVDPPFGYIGDPTTNVTISSAGNFVSTPTAYMTPHGQAAPRYDLKRVAFVDANTITASVPTSTMALGMYDLTVVNPPSDGRTGTLMNAFQVVARPIPVIDDVVPDRGLPNTSVNLDIYGRNFRDPVSVVMLDRAGTVAATATAAAVVSASCTNVGGINECSHVTATITTPTTQDAYLVRVIDTDETTYSTWSAFIVGAEGASGNLHPFAATSTLVTGRRMLAGVSARDDLGNNFIYAIGGDTGGTTPAALKSVEVAELSKFGGLAAWQQEKASNDMTTTRDAPIAATVELPDANEPCSAFGILCLPPATTYVYVVGGRNTAVLGSVERAVVLRNDNAPVMGDPTPTTGGTLATGTWYYKVAAVCSAAATDPDNPNGETLPSDEAVVTLSSAQNAVTLAWTAAPSTSQCHPTGYKVYRTKMVDGASQQELLITPTPVAGLTYTDTGATAGTEPPLPPGALGVWVAETITLNTARWGHQGATIVDNNTSNGGSGKSLYVVGGKSDTSAGYLGSVEYAGIDTNGHLIGTTFSTTNTNAIGTTGMAPVAFFSMVVETPHDVAGYTGTARLFALGGVVAGNGGNGAASSQVIMSDITSGGGNGTWSAYAGAGTIGNRAGDMAVITSNKLFDLGGAGMATNTTFSNITMGGDDNAFTNTGAIGTPFQSTAQAFPAGSPRALGVPITGAGFIYFVGGTSDGSNAVNTTFQTF